MRPPPDRAPARSLPAHRSTGRARRVLPRTSALCAAARGAPFAPARAGGRDPWRGSGRTPRSRSAAPASREARSGRSRVLSRGAARARRVARRRANRRCPPMRSAARCPPRPQDGAAPLRRSASGRCCRCRRTRPSASVKVLRHVHAGIPKAAFLIESARGDVVTKDVQPDGNGTEDLRLLLQRRERLPAQAFAALRLLQPEIEDEGHALAVALL